MALLDIFRSREYLAKLSHLKSLLAVVMADGKIEDAEMASLAIIMNREGLSNSDLERCMKRPESVKFVAPTSDKFRLTYIRDMVRVMSIDGDIDKNELLVCKLTAQQLGYRHEITEAMILEMIAELKQ